MSKQRDVNLEQVLSHELAPAPPSLFNDDGTMRRTTKADLAKKVESNRDEIHVPTVSHDNNTYIIDGMTILQALEESKFDTFNDLGLVVMQTIQSLLTSYLGVTSVTLVFDRYDCEISIKQLQLLQMSSVVGVEFQTYLTLPKCRLLYEVDYESMPSFPIFRCSL